MKHFVLVLLAGLTLVSMATFGQTRTSSTPALHAEQAIRHQFERFAKAMEQGDANTVADIYAPEAVLLLPNTKPVEGRAALRSLFAKSFEQYDTTSYKYTVRQIEVVGDLAFRWGEVTQVMRPKTARSGPKVINSHLKFIDVWKRSNDGKWHIYRDSSVVDMPAALRKLIEGCVQAKQGGRKVS